MPYLFYLEIEIHHKRRFFMKFSKITCLLIGIIILIIITTSCNNNTAKPYPVTGISLNQTTLSMQIGDSRTLTAIIIPENAANHFVSWTSSNSSIVTVSDTGVVIAISQGTATITVATQEGGFSDTCQVTVNQDPFAQVIIHLTTSDGGSPDGATVVLQNHVGSAYQQSATSSTVIFNDIPYGSYVVVVLHADYHQYIDENLSVQIDTVSHDVQLINNLIGTIFYFGLYNWLVLDIQDSNALIVSLNLLEQREYHPLQEPITWADCSLRAYLNDDFYNSDVFSDEDRSRILQVDNINEDNQYYGTPGGVNTQDWIFLLSITEVVKYFGDSGQLDNGSSFINDQYNSNRIATFLGNATSWWLRSPGVDRDNNFASYVRSEGFISLYGEYIDFPIYGVRPAIWLKL